MQQDGTLGTKMPWWWATPTKECTPPGSQQRKSRCPPRNHNHCHGQDNKTDAIDVGKDHSPQDEIALHYIQPNATVRNTHPKEIMVGDVCAPQCNEAYTTIQLPASASRKGTALLHTKVNTRAGGNMLPFHVFQHLYPDQISPDGLPTGPGSCQYQTHCLQQIPYTPIWCTPWAHHLAARLHWHSTLQGILVLVCCRHPWSHILGLPSSEKLAFVKMNCAIMVRQPSTHPAPVSTTVATTKPATAPEAAKSIRSTDNLIREFPDQFQGIGQIPQQIQDLTPSWHPSHDTCPQEKPHHLTSKGQGTPQQDEMPRHDHPCRWTNGLGILHYLCLEGKWQAMSVLGSPWPQWGHPRWSSQDAHCGGSHSQVCTFSLPHQVGCPPWILVNHSWPGLQLAYDFQQSFQKIPFPATSIWPGLFPRHIP